MSPLEVLLVEDSPSDAKLIQATVRQCSLLNVQLTVVTRLEEALNALQQAAYDVTLLDFSLPDSDTPHTLHAIPQLSDYTPIIVLTGLVDEAVSLRALEAGAQDYLVKQNINPDNLARSIRYALARQRAADEQKRSAELHAALERERELNELKSMFVNIVSHEFRNPLTVILTAAGTLINHSDKLTPDKRLRRLTQIRSSVYHLLNMVENILMAGSVEHNQLKLQPAATCMTELCEAAVDDLQFITNGAAHVLFSSNIERGDMIWCDPNLMRQMVTNLLSNAVKYSPKGASVSLSLTREGDEVIFSVRDRGIGMTQKTLDNLFTPFHRASNTQNVRGIGMGLVIVQKIVEAHNGAIYVESAPGEGSLFVVRLPYEQQVSDFAAAR
jgi:signal transduction histidine kinase